MGKFTLALIASTVFFAAPAAAQKSPGDITVTSEDIVVYRDETRQLRCDHANEVLERIADFRNRQPDVERELKAAEAQATSAQDRLDVTLSKMRIEMMRDYLDGEEIRMKQERQATC